MLSPLGLKKNSTWIALFLQRSHTFVTKEFVNYFDWGGSLKAAGFGDGRESHPQASLEAATRRRILFEKGIHSNLRCSVFISHRFKLSSAVGRKNLSRTVHSVRLRNIVLIFIHSGITEAIGP
jgi:hypothetical protein